MIMETADNFSFEKTRLGCYGQRKREVDCNE